MKKQYAEDDVDDGVLPACAVVRRSTPGSNEQAGTALSDAGEESGDDACEWWSMADRGSGCDAAAFVHRMLAGRAYRSALEY